MHCACVCCSSVVQRQLVVDILISGHTHRTEVSECEGKWFINPGSTTGTNSALAPEAVLLAVQVTYVYELRGDQVDVSKSEFSKAQAEYRVLLVVLVMLTADAAGCWGGTNCTQFSSDNTRIHSHK